MDGRDQKVLEELQRAIEQHPSFGVATEPGSPADAGLHASLLRLEAAGKVRRTEQPGVSGIWWQALSALCILLALAVPGKASEDAYYTMDLKEFALAAPADRLHTHLCVTGTVSQVKHEGDDDWHVRLCDDGLCVVLEIVPDIPVSRPAKGSRITACGIERWDSWHSWREIHPVAYWKPVAP